MSVDARFYTDQLRSAFGGRRFLVFGGPVALTLCAGLRDLGAEPGFLLASGPVGPAPDPSLGPPSTKPRPPRSPVSPRSRR